MFGRGSIALVDFLRHPSRDFRLSEAAGLIWQQRLVKSAHEFESKRAACKVATDGSLPVDAGHPFHGAYRMNDLNIEAR
ncbi:hypothetical protein DPM13_17865 [Paracoccus mutanolyticus]|uniref:Uncharacterized protein n=1 Tax=Paracoccus mutanolyticus TaxID=1499308 RepID=A0ABN5MBB4_9RHOB|nr:hypothetical protein [Paracoccus mutanolyticus]AWX94150.1 hypothetical protein DPM13_17865 [Paracoccus mutanolyticus]